MQATLALSEAAALRDTSSGARLACRESRVKYAPEWSDAAAAAVLEHLEAGKQNMSMSAFCTNWLTDPLVQAASI